MAAAASRSPAAADGSALVTFVKGLGCSAGFEPSCKISGAGIDDRRFLLSFAADPRVVHATVRFVAEMAMPAEAHAAFSAAARRAAFLHLGYEEARGQGRFKVYCERTPEGDAPLHTAWKWGPAGGSLSVDDYWLSGGGRAAIGEAFGPGYPVLSAACVALLDGAKEPMLLEVRRRTAPRRSFDLGLYDAGLRVAAAMPVVAAAEVAFGLSGTADRVAGLAGDATLGHVAGGRDDRDEAFVTLYFGARELR